MKNIHPLMNPENTIETYRRIRKAIGFLGFFLPVVLIVLSLIPFFKTPVQPTISNYYYTNLRELLTGTLCAVGLFLIRYKGFKSSAFWKNDNLLTNIAGYMAFCLALFPTTPDCWADKIYSFIPINSKFLGYMHYGFAAAFFVTLAIISINVFTIGQKSSKEIPISAFNENYIYKICGYLMLAFLLLIVVFEILELFTFSTLVCESLALISFGISWLIKGRALGDTGKVGRLIYRETN